MLIERRYDESQLHHAPRELVEQDLAGHVVLDDGGRNRYRYCQSAIVAAYGEMASQPPRFEDVRVPRFSSSGSSRTSPTITCSTLIGRCWATSWRSSSCPGGHSVLWDALDETAAAISAFLTRYAQSSAATAT